MKTAILSLILLSSVSFVYAQQPAHPTKSDAPRTTDSSILLDESANLKADLAQLRAMLNVLASQESGGDPRTVAALQTNRQMWQVVIARLAELTQRMDAIEQRQREAGATSNIPKR